MNKRAFLKRLALAYRRVTGEVSDNADNSVGGGMYARGLANEGWAGGYAQALRDVEALLVHGYPGDPRHYWDEPAPDQRKHPQ